MSVSGLKAIVIGGGQRIGREIATALAEAGVSVVIAARSDTIYAVADQIGDPAIAVETDVIDEESVQSTIEATLEEFGGLDILVNNAGIAGPTAPIEDVTVEEWAHTMNESNISDGNVWY